MIDRVAPTRAPIGQRRVMRQLWRDLLFLHWQVDADEIQKRLPAGLTVDTFEGRAYVGLVPFTMRGVRPIWSPEVPGLSAFHEVNVRTYVHHEGRDPGVWFFSLDAANPIVVAIARFRWRLPYFYAEIDLTHGARIEYTAQRLARKGRRTDARTAMAYEPIGTPAASPTGSREHFLAERYLLYTVDAADHLLIGQVHHAPYPLQPARLLSLDDTLVGSAGITLPDDPALAHYASGVDVDIYPLRRVTRDE